LNVTKLSLLFFLVLNLQISAHSSPVENLYSATVDVESQSNQGRNAGFEKALKQVLVKVTGQQALMENRGLMEAFTPSEKYVQTFSFRENPEYQQYLEQMQREAEQENAVASSPNDGIPDKQGVGDERRNESDGAREETIPLPYLLNVSFAEPSINRILAEYSVPVWGRNRPSILVWMATEKNGDRQIVGATDPEAGQFQALASQRGLPVFFPVGDLSDLNAIKIEELWGLFPGAADLASARYQPDIILMLRVYQTQENSWSANWLAAMKQGFMSGGRDDSSLHEIWDQVGTELAEVLSSRYGIVKTLNGTERVLAVEVGQVNRFQDYLAVQNHLENLPPVSAIRLKWVKGDLIGLEIELVTTESQFMEHLELAGRLQRASAAEAREREAQRSLAPPEPANPDTPDAALSLDSWMRGDPSLADTSLSESEVERNYQLDMLNPSIEYFIWRSDD